MKVWAANISGQVEAVVGPYKLYDSSFYSLQGTEWLSDEVRLELWIFFFFFLCYGLLKWLINPEPNFKSQPTDKDVVVFFFHKKKSLFIFETPGIGNWCIPAPGHWKTTGMYRMSTQLGILISFYILSHILLFFSEPCTPALCSCCIFVVFWTVQMPKEGNLAFQKVK